MSTHDLACFEYWLERFATPEERELPYEEQLEQHIYWLSGWNCKPDLTLIHFPKEILECPH